MKKPFNEKDLVKVNPEYQKHAPKGSEGVEMFVVKVSRYEACDSGYVVDASTLPCPCCGSVKFAMRGYDSGWFVKV